MLDVSSTGPCRGADVASIDQHELSLVAATLPAVSETPKVVRLENTERAVRRFIENRGGPEGLAVCYEAGAGRLSAAPSAGEARRGMRCNRPVVDPDPGRDVLAELRAWAARRGTRRLAWVNAYELLDGRIPASHCQPADDEDVFNPEPYVGHTLSGAMFMSPRTPIASRAGGNRVA